ncbi:hypothetical protein [Flectobacillus longus]|uniref:hypothetical protein n=1 Tax=Flectobacillus longus TaxID=2984207 RepID=UPI0024B6EAC3|nr:hypothetical protein [Flectobacillus longus]MDI9882009.1 hypothetical protein [Flectobacillus longus]
MKNKIQILVSLLAVLMSALGAIAQTTKIPYHTGDNYFIKNTVTEDKLVNPIITDALKFSEIFGMATVMGPKGTPTSIDFKKEFVIAIFQKASDFELSYRAVSLSQIAPKKLQLTYEEKWGKKLSFTMRPFLLLVVDKKYLGELKLKVLKK